MQIQLVADSQLSYAMRRYRVRFWKENSDTKQTKEENKTLLPQLEM